MKTHPTDLHLEALYLDLGPEHGKVLDHLAGCARCRERAKELRRPGIKVADMPDMPESPGGGDPDLHVFSLSLALLREKAEASLRIHREALAALSFLLQAIQSESASAKLVAAVASFIRQAEHDPSLPFQIPEA